MSTVMIVDDSPIVRQPIEAALARAGYDTMSAKHGMEALTKISTEGLPDLILLDLAMPVMDGVAVLETLRADKKSRSVPIIILTAIAEKERVVKVAKLGVSGYLLKSRFSLKEMCDLIARTIENSGRPIMTNAGNVPESTSSLPSEGTGDNTDAAAPSNEAPPQQSSPSPATARPAERQPNPVAADLRSMKPLLTRSELTGRLEAADELKGMSPAVSQVLKLTGSPRCSIEQVSRAINQDHAMALKILKLANSAVYTRGEQVDSVQTAVTRIGLGQIRQSILNISVMECFSSKTIAGIEFGQFWEHAIATGLIAAEIAHQRDPKEADSAFTMGLLHDVGRMFLAEQFSDVYVQVLEIAEATSLPLEQVESRLLLQNHADVMDRLLHAWKFPKQLLNPIVFHHLSAGNIRRNAPRQINEVATLALANRLAHALMLGTSSNEVIYPTEDLCEMLKIDPKVIDTVTAPLDGTRDECDRMKFALLANSSNANWPQLREVHRKELATPIRPIYISAKPQYDAFRIFCEQLQERPIIADDANEEPPNIGVIHLTDTRDRVPLTTAYRAAEQEAGVTGLPLLILSPAGKIMAENSLLNSRPHLSLATPFVIPQFIKAVNELLNASSAIRAKAA